MGETLGAPTIFASIFLNMYGILTIFAPIESWECPLSIGAKIVKIRYISRNLGTNIVGAPSVSPIVSPTVSPKMPYIGPPLVYIHIPELTQHRPFPPRRESLPGPARRVAACAAHKCRHTRVHTTPRVRVWREAADARRRTRTRSRAIFNVHNGWKISIEAFLPTSRRFRQSKRGLVCFRLIAASTRW